MRTLVAAIVGVILGLLIYFIVDYTGACLYAESHCYKKGYFKSTVDYELNQYCVYQEKVLPLAEVEK